MVGKVHKKYARGVRAQASSADYEWKRCQYGINKCVLACGLSILLIAIGLLVHVFEGHPALYEQGRAEGIAQVQTIVDHANAKTAAADLAMSDALAMQDASIMAIRLARETLATCGEVGDASTMD